MSKSRKSLGQILYETEIKARGYADWESWEDLLEEERLLYVKMAGAAQSADRKRLRRKGLLE